MTLQRLAASAATLCLVAMGACVTVNIYFPAPEIREAAEEIVDETWGAVDDLGMTEVPFRSLLAWVAALASPASAEAAGPDINVSTAKIRVLKNAMRERAPHLKKHLASGAIGLGSDGMLEIRDLSDMTLKEQVWLRRELEAENRDRMQLYREIAAANDLGAERVADIQAIFAATWIAKAEKGWWVEDADGTWKRR